MTFLHPEFLYLMLPMLVILFFFLLTQREASAAYFSEEVLNRLRVNTKMMTLRARNALFLMMFIFFIIALAQPVIEEGKVTVEAKSADIMIALDISDSMLAEDVYPSRIEQGKQKIIGLLEHAPQERLGVSAFARASYLVAPLSFDHRAVHFLVKQLQPSFITEKGTDFKALLEATAKMMEENAKKYLLIVTDGGDQERFDEEIALAKKEGITLFVLGIGTEKGAPIKEREGGGFVKQNGSIVITTLNKAVSALATETGGVYIESVTSDADIRAMLSEIEAKTVKRSLEEQEITRYGQLFYVPLGVGMLLLLIATSSMSRRERMQMPHALILFALLAQGVPSQAGLLDFTLLDDAKAAYDGRDYNRSAALYGEYASRHRSNASLYNTAGALYKNGRYDEAAQRYEQVQFTDPKQQFDVWHNLGNAYAKQGTTEALQKALDAYQKALAVREEAPTRENFETVRKLLEEQQKQQQNQGAEQQGKKQQEGDKQSASQGNPRQQGENNATSSGEDNASQNENNTQQQKSDSNATQEQQGSSQAEKQDAAEKQSESARPQQGKSDRNATEEEPAAAAETAAAEDDAPQMSDLEAQKWLKMLDERPVSHIYRIGPAVPPEKESENEKPW